MKPIDVTPPELTAAERKALTQLEYDIYMSRMSTDPPRNQRYLANQFELPEMNVKARWTAIRKKLGYDPLRKWKESGQLPAQGNPAGRPGVDDKFERLREVSSESLGKLAGMRAEEGLRILSGRMDEAPTEKLPKMIADLIGVRQLMKGEPTGILRVDQRGSLKRLMRALPKELERRKLMIDGEGVKPIPTTIESETVA